jgi:phosphomannomutase
MTDIHFGTDGWRGVIAEDFTFANVERASQATADYWSTHPVAGTERAVIIGYDRRFLSAEFARRTAEVFAANGFAVILTPDPTPTPCVSFAVKQLRAVGGVMITASHNPPKFNGFKLKAHFGGSADSATCAEVEKLLSPLGSLPRAGQTSAFAPQSGSANTGGGSIQLRDLRPAHFRAIKRLVDFPLIAKSGLRVAHDALFGVGAGAFTTLLAGTTCSVTTLNGAPDPLFGGINPEPLAKNYVLGAAALRRDPHDFCLVTDGDSDRIGAMDGRGNPFTNQQVIAFLLHHLVRNRQQRGRVVKTINTTAMVDKMCAAWNLPLTEVGIGFKYIAAEMLRGDVLLGAEESGSVGFAGHIPERDGLAAGLFLLEMLATERVSANRIMARLEKEFGPHRYGRIDTRFPLEKRAALMARLQTDPPARLGRSPVQVVKTFDGVKFESASGIWLGLRGSGTESVVRIYAEAGGDAELQRLLRQGVKLVGQV